MISLLISPLKFALRCSYRPSFSRPLINSKFLSKKALDVNTNVTKDVILFKNPNDKFYKIISIFAVFQFGFWTYLSIFAYTTLKDSPVDTEKAKAWYEKINLGENKYRNGLTLISFLIGWGLLSVSWMYCLRSVKYLILRKGGREVTIVTFTPTGRNRMFTLGVENINCKELRQTAKAHIPLKVKGHSFHYLLDVTKGEFRNPLLFDHTAGLRRDWKS
ncbi:unnamed protein product [Acanthoscelides obtectus]|uniref:Transmembrane protein 223 n=1 Tax=Acanthoscelides obtectus TaxID=200917 RepID=A0A9P0L1N5_ACAOB|nr:unnamed protein product [Acanthoscelides obtectus]CAK1676652.1 Transmembrane protein 223 [Acanthoscelides obtectus]